MPMAEVWQYINSHWSRQILPLWSSFKQKLNSFKSDGNKPTHRLDFREVRWWTNFLCQVNSSTWIHCPLLTPHHLVRWLGPACWQVHLVTRSSSSGEKFVSTSPLGPLWVTHGSYQLGFPDPWWAITLRKQQRTFPDSWTSRTPSIAFSGARRLRVSIKCNLPFLSMLPNHNPCVTRFGTRELTWLSIMCHIFIYEQIPNINHNAPGVL